MGIAALLVLCLISLTTCSLSTCAAAFRAHDLRRGLEKTMRGRLLADSTEGGAVVPIHLSQARYVANFTIGTPPQPASAFIDLSGELVWTQCKQCGRCFKQELPLFDPTKSSTYRPEPCGTPLCESIPPDSRNCSGKVCMYEATTEAGETGGIVGTDTFTVGTAKASLAFGCVVASDIDTNTMDGPSGFVGLGRTPWSLVTQTNVTKFSYCLAPHDAGNNSALFLGASAKLAGGKSASTPFVNTSGLSNRYKVHLEGLKAGDAVIALPPSGSTVLLDTYSPVSFLVDSAYQALKKAVTAAIGAAPTAPTPQQTFDLCFPKASASSAPDLVLTFQGAAAMTVPPSNYLLDDDNGTVCLAILNSARLNLPAGFEGLSILGSLPQENIHLLFDLDKETLSFQPADCTKLS